MSVAQEPRPRRPVPWVRRLAGSIWWFTIVVGGVTFLIAYDKGGFAISNRATTAIVAWWAVLLGLGLGVWPRSLTPRAAWIVGSLLIAFAVWTFASTAWTKSAEQTFLEFDRVTMYLGIFLIAVCAGARANVHRWAQGLTLGIVAIALVSLISRLFPSTFSLQGLPTFLPRLTTRLSFPLGYWNGLGIFVGFAFPLCLGGALRARRWWSRAFALMPLPLLAAVIFLTSSRGGVVVACVGALVFLAFTERRWAAVGALLAAAGGAAAAIGVLLSRHELVDGPVRSHAAAVQGHEAFVLILAISLATGAVFAIGHRLFGGVRPSPVIGPAALAVLAVGLVVTALVSDPAQRFRTFKQLPTATQVETRDFVRTHLLSGAGSGRWQFWTAAVDEWRSAPVLGRGAGSYQAWWAEHGSFAYFVRNAHSLYLEVLGELGLVGFLLLAGALAYGVVEGARRTLRLGNDERVIAASLLGVVSAFCVGAGIEWIWQLTAISGAGMVCLGLLTGPATMTTPLSAVSPEARPRPRRVPRFALSATLLALGWLALCAQAIPWLTDVQIKASAAAVGRNDGEGALRHALDAKSIQPWAASPYLQLALVEEQMRHLRTARKWIGEAIEHDPSDWRLWLVSARIETEAGNIDSARQRIRRAASLNPRSPLFAGVPH